MDMTPTLRERFSNVLAAGGCGGGGGGGGAGGVGGGGGGSVGGVGEGEADVPVAELGCVVRAASDELAQSVLSSDGWHLWHFSLEDLLGQSAAIMFADEALGSVEVVESLPLGKWKPRVGGYRWVAARSRKPVSRAEFHALMAESAVAGLQASPDAYAVRVARCKLFSDVRSIGDADGVKFAPLSESRMPTGACWFTWMRACLRPMSLEARLWLLPLQPALPLSSKS